MISWYLGADGNAILGMADGQLTDLHELAKRNRYGNLTTNLAFSQNCHAHTSAVESGYPTT